ncbi:hypothetical protein X801_02440, partial [Opisthorchis viverrini]
MPAPQLRHVGNAWAKSLLIKSSKDKPTSPDRTRRGNKRCEHRVRDSGVNYHIVTNTVTGQDL